MLRMVRRMFSKRKKNMYRNKRAAKNQQRAHTHIYANSELWGAVLDEADNQKKREKIDQLLLTVFSAKPMLFLSNALLTNISNTETLP